MHFRGFVTAHTGQKKISLFSEKQHLHVNQSLLLCKQMHGIKNYSQALNFTCSKTQLKLPLSFLLFFPPFSVLHTDL